MRTQLVIQAEEEKAAPLACAAKRLYIMAAEK